MVDRPVPAVALESNEPELSSEAQALFEPGFQEDVAASAYDADPAEDETSWETLEISAVGTAERADARTVRVPVTLRDERGRELRVSLSVRIDPEDLNSA